MVWGQVVHNICKPVKGIVKKWNEQDDYPNGQFYILKTDGSPESPVQFQLIPGIARTYEDCIEIYNQLIRDKIEKLRKIADDLENELL